MADSQNEVTPNIPSVESITPGIKAMILIDKQVRYSIIDYALGGIIIGLIPFYGGWITELRIVALIMLNLKMAFNVGRFWGYNPGQGIIEIIGLVLGIIGALALGIFSWILVFTLGLFIPLADSLARAAAYGAFTWSLGITISKYYFSSRSLDAKALERAWIFYQSNQKRKFSHKKLINEK